MKKMNPPILLNLLASQAERWQRQGMIIRVPAGEDLVFIGDTHGDIEAVRNIWRQFKGGEAKLIFLGDYVDRSATSAENLSFLLSLQQENMERIILLRGNHEAWRRYPFWPADFWESLSENERREVAVLLDKLPLLAVGEGWVALHGALPALRDLEEVEKREEESQVWRPILWGDWQEEEGEYLGEINGRPQFGRRRFEQVMEWWGKQVLIRSHQPHAPRLLFDRRCITVFTSASYGTERAVALLPGGRQREKVWEGKFLKI
jgi:hypothetical protein